MEQRKRGPVVSQAVEESYGTLAASHQDALHSGLEV